MLGLGLISVAGHAKELHWLLAVFAGIIMCKIVYQLTGAISPLFFMGYVKLDDLKKLEWNNRGFSTFHALLVAAASLYLLLESDLFHDGARDDLMINRTSAFSDTILGISTGYFLADLAMIFYYFPALGGTEYVLHHGLSVFAIVQSLLSGQAQIYIFMVLFTESTTPFVNLRWYLDVAGQKNSQLYVCNGVALFFGWLVARILLFLLFFYHMFSHFDQVQVLNRSRVSDIRVPQLRSLSGESSWFEDRVYIFSEIILLLWLSILFESGWGLSQ
ncbi:TLC domain-containing protein 4-B isoform X1 [Capsicum annuum]|uniref:TLC domain-containing protein 4-B isoform X1 n=1 Tax=Capsicum annuum TaxID=4072 RepID=UPI001FB14DB4|nr:TLC domain-containing protein 4-B isoform X1 [Capsicum annuum]